MNAGTVLLVEDEPALRGLIQRVLVSAGYEVVEAKNGVEALHSYRPGGVDLVITDVQMPFMDGVSLAQRLWAQGQRPQFLVISARPLGGTLPPGTAFLRKPFTREDLLGTVRILVGSATAGTLCERGSVD